MRRLGVAALLGGATGCALLLLTSEATFERIAPLLIAGASLAILPGRGRRTVPPTATGARCRAASTSSGSTAATSAPRPA